MNNYIKYQPQQQPHQLPQQQQPQQKHYITIIYNYSSASLLFIIYLFEIFHLTL